MSHRHLDEAEVLNCLLETGELPAEVGACAQCAAAGAELERFLAAFRPGPERADSALVSRILARTTREDLAWRGDVSLLFDFVRQRLAASGVLRFAAASLAAHLVALPVFAWLALRPEPPERSFRAHLTTREQALPAVPQEPERELELPVLPEPHAVESEHVGPALRRRQERLHLLSSPVPPEAAAPSDAGNDPYDGVAQLLRLRAARLSGERDPEAVRAAAPTLSSALERVLWVELLMDHLVLAGERLPALEAGLQRMGEPDAGSAAVRRLETLALERAAGLGLLDGDGLLLLRERGPIPGAPGAAEPRAVGARGFGSALEAALGPGAGGWADWDR